MTVGRTSRSITLEADAHHLLTDVWTSIGVIIGVGLVWLTGWLWLDPTIALLVAANILWTGWQLMRRSAAGLMDASLPKAELDRIEAILASYRRQGLDFHALRTRQAGRRAFITLHILVPGAWTVQHGHDWSERIEADLRKAVPGAHVTTHLEPMEDPVSHIDRELDRRMPPRAPRPRSPTPANRGARDSRVTDLLARSPVVLCRAPAHVRRPLRDKPRRIADCCSPGNATC